MIIGMSEVMNWTYYIIPNTSVSMALKFNLPHKNGIPYGKETTWENTGLLYLSLTESCCLRFFLASKMIPYQFCSRFRKAAPPVTVVAIKSTLVYCISSDSILLIFNPVSSP